MNGIESVTYGGKEPFAITGPGEYEHSGVVIQGFQSKSKYGLQKGAESALNTVYLVELEDMTLLHLGALSDEDLSKEARENINEVDVLFVPIGGDGVLASGPAHELAVSLEPKILIPIHVSGAGGEKALETFLKEAGTTGEKFDKLTLKKKDLAGRDGSILVLTA
jgi:L-ascorbate metabolism protein UlaG (beta-lactamase superfamily)